MNLIQKLHNATKSQTFLLWLVFGAKEVVVCPCINTLTIWKGSNDTLWS